MAGNNFDLIMQEIFHQKQLMDELIDANNDLRRQLTNLREGQGIYLEIDGNRFPLIVTPIATIDSPQTQPILTSQSQDPTISTQSTISIALNESQIFMGTIPETPPPTIDELEPTTHYRDEVVEEVSPPPTPTPSFLEDMLADEFASAVTSPIAAATWPDSNTAKRPAPKTQKLTSIDEDEKAALRKQLIGSFLLE